MVISLSEFTWENKRRREEAHMKDEGMARRRLLGGLAAAPLAAAQGRAAAGPAKWKLVVGCDHAGFPLKGPVIQTLQAWGHTVKDIGTYSTLPVDFPDIAQRLCNEILSGRSQRGIMVCGTGVGAAIAVNKVRGMRAALCHDTFCAHQCVEHDDVNVLCLGAWIIGPKLAEEVLNAYLNARFASEDADLKRRVQKLMEMEKR
ncbi:ribose-5-phosphate isomerase [Candidatus Sulfopaludibacter sp. SbA3]|nr:ribose-5-phosphate isomerase [Candidatus Sulfopaludibacter sp. SbA3]